MRRSLIGRPKGVSDSKRSNLSRKLQIRFLKLCSSPVHRWMRNHRLVCGPHDADVRNCNLTVSVLLHTFIILMVVTCFSIPQTNWSLKECITFIIPAVIHFGDDGVVTSHRQFVTHLHETTSVTFPSLYSDCGSCWVGYASSTCFFYCVRNADFVKSLSCRRRCSRNWSM